jgi:hypothetical protein
MPSVKVVVAHVALGLKTISPLGSDAVNALELTVAQVK